MEAIDVYLVPYHSLKPTTSRLAAASGRFFCVEKAIEAKEWPYDNGDDPSFFAARHDGGLLTWGVCRRDVRSKIRPGDMCVFLAFTKEREIIRYKMSAVATVLEKLDRRSVVHDSRFQGKTYINLLIRPDGNGWKYDEDDRHKGDRHSDWLWRLSEHGPTGKKQFNAQNKDIRETGHFADSDVSVAKDYIVFSQRPDETYISPNPPLVALAGKGEHEKWVSNELARLTVDKAAGLHPNGRNFLRSTSQAYVHRQLTFRMRADEVSEWRNSLISTLQQASSGSA